MFCVGIFLLCLGWTQALDLDLCAATNLGTISTSYQFMSNGYCQNYCVDQGYSVAITQEYDCWCSNEVPGDTVSTSECNTGCPGFSEEEDCGGSGVYGYIIVGSPTKTVYSSSATSTTSSSTSTSSSSTSRTTSSTSATTSATTSSTSSTTSTSASSRTSASTTSAGSESASTTASSSSAGATSQSSSETTPTTVSPSTMSVRATTIISLVTVSGSQESSVQTQYVTEPVSHTSTQAKSSKSFFDSTGKVAGTFTAVGVVVVALVSTLLYCCCFGGRKSDEDEFSENYSSDNSSLEKKIGANGYPSPKDPDAENLKRNSSSKSIRSMLGGLGAAAGGISRSQSRSKLSGMDEPLESGPSMFPISEFDTVLDPSTLFGPNQSNVSLNDENDYSRRVLHVANPE